MAEAALEVVVSPEGAALAAVEEHPAAGKSLDIELACGGVALGAKTHRNVHPGTSRLGFES